MATAVLIAIVFLHRENDKIESITHFSSVRLTLMTMTEIGFKFPVDVVPLSAHWLDGWSPHCVIYAFLLKERHEGLEPMETPGATENPVCSLHSFTYQNKTLS